MLKKLDVSFSLITALVLKSLLVGINLPEALAIGFIIGYKGYKDYLESKPKANESNNLSERVNSIEAKLNAMSMVRR